MKIVTKYAMLMLLTTSFIALNNCGSDPTGDIDSDFEHDQNAQASNFLLPGSLPPGYPTLSYPGLLHYLPSAIETNCNNGVDDDGDGLSDCADRDCHVHPQCAEFGPPFEDLINDRSITIYPNGVLVPEDILLQKARSARRWDGECEFGTDLMFHHTDDDNGAGAGGVWEDD